MASLSKPTTLFPSAPDALKPLVQLIRIPWMEERENVGWRAADQVAPFRLVTSYLVDVLVSHRERESETQRELLVLHVMMVQKVGHALSDVVKELQRRRRRKRRKQMRHKKTAKVSSNHMQL